jgi:cytochrome c5
MLKLGLFASIASLVATVALAAFASTADANKPCKTTDFKTDMVKAACAKGGQDEAKAVMKKLQKEAKLKNCNACHSKLAPDYPLKDDGLEQFKKAGGK